MGTSSRVISILVVEDVDEMRYLMEHLLQSIPGIKVSGLARNTHEARLEVGRRRPDLIFLDEILPSESSQDLLQEFIELKIPVFLMTSLENPTHALPDGVQVRFTKPGWKSLEEDSIRIKKLVFEHLK